MSSSAPVAPASHNPPAVPRLCWFWTAENQLKLCQLKARAQELGLSASTHKDAPLILVEIGKDPNSSSTLFTNYVFCIIYC